MGVSTCRRPGVTSLLAVVAASAWPGATSDVSTVALAKVDPGEPTAEYDGRFAFTRIRYGAAVDLAGGRFRREPTWAHDFPRAEFNFLKILSELTFVPTMIDQGNIRDARRSGSGDVSDRLHVGAGLLDHDRGGDGGAAQLPAQGRLHHLRRLPRQSHPEPRVRRCAGSIRRRRSRSSTRRIRSFTLFSKSTPSILGQAITREAGDTEWLGIYEDNDPRKRLIAIANNNHDLGELWEFSDTGYVPVDLSNEAYKFGVNYVMYAMTH